jgi:hypothetical protein
MFLSANDLWELTGYKRPDKQAEWLRSRAYPFDMDAHGRPKVLRTAVERRLGGKVEREREPQLHLP